MHVNMACITFLKLLVLLSLFAGKTGLGVASSIAITSVQPFFVSFSLPYSVIRGETVKLPVTVFNYLSESLVIELNMKDMPGIRVPRELRKTEVCVCGKESVTHTFKLIAEDFGKVNVTARAQAIENNGVCGNNVTMSTEGIGARDAVIRELLVEPEGREVDKSFSDYVCPSGDPITMTMAVVLPVDVVPDSARASINVIGDLMGSTVSNLDALLKMPTGGGEQNIVMFAANIYVMKYLTATNQLNEKVHRKRRDVDEEIQRKAIRYMSEGYKRQLTYSHDEGGFSAFGEDDDHASTWLTAFVIKSFQEASEFITIDARDVNVSLEWLISTQLENGCFSEHGDVIHSDINGAALTAYVVIALLVAGLPNDDPTITRALLYVDEQPIPDNDMYTNALLAYTYSLTNPGGGRYEETMDVLYDNAKDEDGMVHWADAVDTPNGRVRTFHHLSSADVERTAYVLMAIVEGAVNRDDVISKGLAVVQLLFKQINAHGGFGSTQDTVVSLQALAMYGSAAYSDDMDMTVTAGVENATYSFSVSTENSMVLQQHMISAPNNVTFNIEGEGCVFVQTNVRYNVIDTKDNDIPDSFELRARAFTTKGNNSRKRDLQICARYLGEDGYTNMAVISIKMASGWVPDKETLEKLRQNTTLMLKHFEFNENYVDLYFDELANEDRCLTFTIEQGVVVENIKPAIVKLYDYYDGSLTARTEYSIRS